MQAISRATCFITRPQFAVACDAVQLLPHLGEIVAKSHAREIIDRLPESASWDDVMYELYVRESIDAGLADVAAGRTIPHEQVRARLSELVRRAS